MSQWTVETVEVMAGLFLMDGQELSWTTWEPGQPPARNAVIYAIPDPMSPGSTVYHVPLLPPGCVCHTEGFEADTGCPVPPDPGNPTGHTTVDGAQSIHGAARIVSAWVTSGALLPSVNQWADPDPVS